MPAYTYKVRDKTGVLVKGSQEASDINSLAQFLRSQSYSVVSIDKAFDWIGYGKDLLQKIRGIRYQEVIFFTRQLSTLLASGVTLDAALESLSNQVRNKKFRIVIKEIIFDIQSGQSLSDALMKHPDVFSQVYTSMIKAAEAAGMLDKVLERLAKLGFQDLEIRSRIRSALTYPVILVSLSIGIVSYLLAAVVPKFVAIFSVYGFSLPLATRILLNISFLIRYAWVMVIIFLIGVIFWLKRYMKSSEGRYRIDYLMLRIPVFGEFYLKVNLTQFSHTLSTLIKSGVPILEALSVTQKTVKNRVIQNTVQDIRLAISEGKSITEPFVASGIFPPMVVQMISAGEKTGKLDQMLSEVAQFYAQEIEYSIRNISSILEPILLLIMGLMVAFIALSVLSPIFNLIKLFRQG